MKTASPHFTELILLVELNSSISLVRVLFSENSNLDLAVVISRIGQSRGFILAEGVSAVDVSYVVSLFGILKSLVLTWLRTY